MTGEFVFREMNRPEIRHLIDLADREGWNPGRHDAESFWLTDREGFLAVESEGAVIGGGSIVRHNPHFGFMGLFIMEPEHRGRGIGARLWTERRDRLLARLDSGGSIGLDAVEAMIPFYERGGFVTAFRHVRYRWEDETPTVDARVGFTDLESLPLDDILRFDRDCFPGPRASCLKAWIAQPEAHKIAAVQGSRLNGFGVIRPCRNGWKIGPLVARDQATALALLKRLITLGSPDPVFLDVPDNNPLAVDLCQKIGMKAGCFCTRMYLGKPARVASELVYGAATMELG